MPRNMKIDELIALFKHIAGREASHGISNAFRFKTVSSGRKKGTLHPARYKKVTELDDDNNSESTSAPAPMRRRKRKEKRVTRDIFQTQLNQPDVGPPNTQMNTPSENSSAPIVSAARRSAYTRPNDLRVGLTSISGTTGLHTPENTQTSQRPNIQQNPQMDSPTFNSSASPNTADDESVLIPPIDTHVGHSSQSSSALTLKIASRPTGLHTPEDSPAPQSPMSLSPNRISRRHLRSSSVLALEEAKRYGAQGKHWR